MLSWGRSESWQPDLSEEEESALLERVIAGEQVHFGDGSIEAERLSQVLIHFGAGAAFSDGGPVSSQEARRLRKYSEKRRKYGPEIAARQMEKEIALLDPWGIELDAHRMLSRPIAVTAVEFAVLLLHVSSSRTSSGKRALAAVYLVGYGPTVPRNTHEAVKWLESAAQEGDPLAPYLLGFLYDTGTPGAPDASLAAAYYMEAVQRGNLRACCGLGQMLRDGRGLTRDRKAAMKLFRTGSDAGDPAASYCLGSMMLDEPGSTQHAKEAISLIKIGAAAGLPEATNDLACMYYSGSHIKRAKPDKALRMWASLPDYDPACYNLASHYVLSSEPSAITKNEIALSERLLRVVRRLLYDEAVALLSNLRFRAYSPKMQSLLGLMGLMNHMVGHTIALWYICHSYWS